MKLFIVAIYLARSKSCKIFLQWQKSDSLSSKDFMPHSYYLVHKFQAENES